MVKSRLKALIAERNAARLNAGLEPLTVRKISDDTGLSTSIIGGLNSGRSKMVAFETLNSLCEYLECAPGDILIHQANGIAPSETNGIALAEANAI